MPTKKNTKTIKRETREIDATDKVLGRLATQVATLLRGKNKATFQPHIDGGDAVVVLHIAQVKFTGQKINQKVYHRYTGYPGGLKTESMSRLMKDNPAEVFRRAVYQMLPDNRLRKGMMKRLHISND